MGLDRCDAGDWLARNAQAIENRKMFSSAGPRLPLWRFADGSVLDFDEMLCSFRALPSGPEADAILRHRVRVRLFWRRIFG